MNTVQYLQQTYSDVAQATGANTPHILYYACASWCAWLLLTHLWCIVRSTAHLNTNSSVPAVWKMLGAAPAITATGTYLYTTATLLIDCVEYVVAEGFSEKAVTWAFTLSLTQITWVSAVITFAFPAVTLIAEDTAQYINHHFALSYLHGRIWRINEKNNPNDNYSRFTDSTWTAELEEMQVERVTPANTAGATTTILIVANP